MAQKNATPTKAQQDFIRAAGFSPAYWTVAKDLPRSLIICHRETKEFRMIDKIANACENGGNYGR